jgi:AcrR family transcriptional regulator
MPRPSRRPRLDPAVHDEFRRRTIVTAMAELCAEQGYEETRITDIAARAAMGRNSVYSLYRNREAVLLDLLDRAAAELLSLSEGACASATAEPKARIEAALVANLGWVAERPANAHTLLVVAPAAAPASRRRHQEAISALAAVLRTAVPDRDPQSPWLEEDRIERVAAILARQAREGRLESAPSLLEDLLVLVTAPYFEADSED